MAISRRTVLICERDITHCCLMQDHHWLVNLTPQLAFWPDLLQGMVTCTTDVSDVNKQQTVTKCARTALHAIIPISEIDLDALQSRCLEH